MNTLAFCPRKTKRLEKRAAWILSFDDASYLISPHITKQMIEQTRMKAKSPKVIFFKTLSLLVDLFLP